MKYSLLVSSLGLVVLNLQRFSVLGGEALPCTRTGNTTNQSHSLHFSEPAEIEEQNAVRRPIVHGTRGGELRFANLFGSHMVLQKAPTPIVLWGYYTPAEVERRVVIVTGSAYPGQTFKATLTARAGSSPVSWRWEARLPALPASNTGHTFSVQLKMQDAQTTNNDNDQYFLQANIEDVLVGDVWVCSGQSNMQFSLHQAFGGADAVREGEKFPQIRLMSLAPLPSEQPLDEARVVELPWSRPTKSSLQAPNNEWGPFSAMCWFYGLRLYQQLNYPVGLIQSAVGGTPIRAWSPPEVLNQCGGGPYPPSGPPGSDPNLQRESVLWNSMIQPLTSSPIFGLIWYQGESDVVDQVDADKYSCRFPALIAEWRRRWANVGASSDLPVGFVQLEPWDVHRNATCKPEESCTVATVRWGQTAGVGWVPNYKMPRTFMAVALDYGDPVGFYGDIHPRDKEPVAKRLVLGALAVAYGWNNLQWSGPRPLSAAFDASKGQVVISFDNLWGGLVLKARNGFELRTSGGWEEAVIEGLNEDRSAVYVRKRDWKERGWGTRGGAADALPIAVRYNWYTAPCSPATGVLLCPLYSRQGDQPVSPFIMQVL